MSDLHKQSRGTPVPYHPPTNEDVLKSLGEMQIRLRGLESLINGMSQDEFAGEQAFSVKTHDAPTDASYLRLYDLFDVTTTSFRVFLGPVSSSLPVFYGNHFAEYTGDSFVFGTGMSYSAYTDFKDPRYCQNVTCGGYSGTIAGSDHQYVWLNADITDNAEGDGPATCVWTLKAGSSITDLNHSDTPPTTAHQVFPLWYIPWSTDHINEAGIIKLETKHVSGESRGLCGGASFVVDGVTFMIYHGRIH
jgi:hypothetical protein